MGERSADRPQLDFPALVSDILTQLQVRGQIGLLDLSPSVQPIYIAAAREGITLGTLSFPAFDVAEIFDDFSSGVLAPQVLLTTGALPVGTYDVVAQVSAADAIVAAVGGAIEMRHRSLNDMATLATLTRLPMSQLANQVQNQTIVLAGHTMAEGERFNWSINMATGGLSNISTHIWVKRRAVP